MKSKADYIKEVANLRSELLKAKQIGDLDLSSILADKLIKLMAEAVKAQK